MNSLPICIQLKSQSVLVIGGNEAALEKVQVLLKAEAKVTLVATHICEQLLALASSELSIITGEYKPEQITNKTLIVAATNNLSLHKQIVDDAKQNNTLVNIVNEPELCTFSFPIVIDRSPMTIAISSNGKAPILTRLWKEKLESIIPRWTGKFAQITGEFRDTVRQAIPNVRMRRYYWERIFRGETSKLAKLKDWTSVQKNLEKEIHNNELLNPKIKYAPTKGKVFLVGGGPGDPDLLTIKALRVMQAADVIVYDYLITDEILSLCNKGAEYISVGKKAGNHTLPQEQINQLLVDLAYRGKVVCRLKGGDPYIYGRGGEEAQLLAKNNIQYQVVPGITAAAACSAAVGIPLTHRDYAQSLQFVTGHLKKSTDANAESDTNWQSLATANQTLVIYMGIIQSPEIKSQLIKHGRAADTPVAIIEKGTRPDQRVVIGTLNTLDELVQTHQIGSPALIIVGEVVALYSQLNNQDDNKQASQNAQQELAKLAVEAQESAA